MAATDSEGVIESLRSARVDRKVTAAPVAAETPATMARVVLDILETGTQRSEWELEAIEYDKII